jgi:hypothetical protein
VLHICIFLLQLFHSVATLLENIATMSPTRGSGEISFATFKYIFSSTRSPMMFSCEVSDDVFRRDLFFAIIA